MRSFVTELVHLFLQVPLWMFIALAAAAAWSWRAPRGSHRRRWRWPLAMLAALFWILTAPALPVTVESNLEHVYDAPRITDADRSADNVILVLTAGWLRKTRDGWDQRLGEAGWVRTVEAVDLWKRIGGRILITGAPTPDGRDSAAAAMGRLAMRLGVPPEAVLVEPRAANTHENLLFSKRMVEGRRARIWLLTSALHMPRSVATARAVGMEVTPYPCDFRANEVLEWTDYFPSNQARASIESVVHELIGIVAYRVRGWGA
ncbi:MAG: YdcF family protein [Betaproteobacteria bacterium]|nr:YdcF family protein [Betaproteobacteria bacterium]